MPEQLEGLSSAASGLAELALCENLSQPTIRCEA